jgi:dienelactone hydrolase
LSKLGLPSHFTQFPRFAARAIRCWLPQLLHSFAHFRLFDGDFAMRLLLLCLLLGFAPLGLPPLVHGQEASPITYPPPAEVKAAFLKLLDRPKMMLDPQVSESKTDAAGTLEEKLTFASEKKPDGQVERVPLLLISPKSDGKKLPCVIVLHGTGGNKESQRGYLVDLAKRGIIGVAIDARYHGERVAGKAGRDAYVAAITRAWQTKPGEPQEHPFYYDTAWDLWRTVDYLVTRPDVDPERIGMIGFSMGGIQTWLAAAVDERVKVAVPAIGVQSFRWSLEHDEWQGRAKTIKAAHDTAAKDLGEKEVNQRVCRELWNKVIPGMLDQFDCPSMLRLFANRSLLIVNGDKDPNCPIGGAKLAFASAEQAFAAAKRSEHLKIMVAEGVGHSVTAEQRTASLDWFERWLR